MVDLLVQILRNQGLCRSLALICMGMKMGWSELPGACPGVNEFYRDDSVEEIFDVSGGSGQ